MRFGNSKKNLVLFAAVVLLVIVHAASADWLPGWNYRKGQTITGSTASDQIDYQMKMTVHKGSGTDSNTDVYCGENCRYDFGDISWTTSDGKTPMDYWIESVASGNNAVFWIEIPYIPESPGTFSVYMYYGNSDAASDSNGTNTFEFFDTFSGGSLDVNKWDTLIASSGGSISVSNDKLTISQQSSSSLETRMWTRNNYSKYTTTEFKVSQPDGWDSGCRQSWFGRGENGSQGGFQSSSFLDL